MNVIRVSMCVGEGKITCFYNGKFFSDAIQKYSEQYSATGEKSRFLWDRSHSISLV